MSPISAIRNTCRSILQPVLLSSWTVPLAWSSLTLFVCVGAVSADTIHVNAEGTGQYATVQAAIDAAVDSDVIELAPGTYRGLGNRDLTYGGKAITIRSETDSPETCVIDCEGTEAEPHRGFIFASGETRAAALQGVTITHGWSDGGGGILIESGSSPTVRLCVITGNTAEYPGNGYGGGIDCSGGALIDGCFITDNVAGNRGGGISTHNAEGAQIVDCTILRNRAEDGGGVHCRENAAITRCLIADNEAAWGDGWGGGISCRNHSSVISHCTLAGNSAIEGGAIAFYSGATDVQYCVIATSLAGGAFAIVGGTSPSPEVLCTDIFGNIGGAGDTLLPGMIDGGGLIFLDPKFCAPDRGDYTVDVESPCLSHECGQMGAFGAGCDILPVEETTWGAIKARYQRQ